MGVFFTLGEKKTRAGVYQRYENVGKSSIAGVINGIVALAFNSDWGPLGAVSSIVSEDQIEARYGTGGTTDAITEIKRGGARQVICVRVGTGGTKGTLTIKDTTATPADAVTITAKYVGTRAFSYELKTAIGQTGYKQFLLYEGTTIKENILFASGTGVNEVDNFIAAAANSVYLDVVKVASYDGTDILATTATKTDITAGTNPATATVTDYSAAFSILEAYRWNVITTDSESTDIHAVLAAYITRVFGDGKMAFALVAEPTSVAIATRQTNAKAFNQFNTIYVGGEFHDASGNSYEGYRAGARIAGMAAAVPSNESLTHRPITGAVGTKELLTNAQYEDCIKSGMLTFSQSADGVIWIESGITTLTTLTGEDDEGWKKIKRTKIRFEMMDRSNDTIAPIIGQISNNDAGRTNVIEVVQKVLDKMIAEEKLLSGATVLLDTSNPPEGDSSWFVIQADDIDSNEKVYLTFKFRFSPLS